jgi:RNA polymerase sigma-70 factor (ECF subfamily)
MKPRLRRSTRVSTAVATASEAPPRQGSRVAFESLYRESRDDVFAYVAGLLRDRSAAEEVTSQAFERAWRKRRQIRPERGSARSWLFGIARNAALDELRRRSRLANVPEESLEAASGGSDLAEDAVSRTAIRQALDGLGGRDRELVALKYFAGLSNSEVASVVGTSESNVGTRLHRVIEKLRRSFDEDA